MLRDLGLVKDVDLNALTDTNDLPYIELYRLIVPPKTAHRHSSAEEQKNMPYRNIAFNGFAYSLLNPTVAFVSAHWISEYFSGDINIPPQQEIDKGTCKVIQTNRASPANVCSEIKTFHNWQSKTFGSHGAKGVHIGPHATLYTDMLLLDIGLQSGHVTDGWPGPFRSIREWFRPMFPALYTRVVLDRENKKTK